MARQRFGTVRARSLLRKELAVHLSDGQRLPPVHFVNHHLAHLAAARYSAPFDPDAAIVVDGRGEIAATSLYLLKPGAGLPSACEWYPFPDSLGVSYGAVTQVLGYEPIADEYKVMGLASYGSPDRDAERKIDALLRVHANGKYQVNISMLRPEHCSAPGRPWLGDRAMMLLAGEYGDGDTPTPAAHNLAYALQHRLEEALCGLTRRLVARGSRRFVIGGGVAMNAVAIGRIRGVDGVEALHVPLAPTDAGASVGAALALLERLRLPMPGVHELTNPFVGPGYTVAELEQALAGLGWRYWKCEDAAWSAAQDIAAGRILGWFDGRMEFGERALGARSILADPRDPAVRDRINVLVKRRETYRPFAPSVLEENAPMFFATERSRRMGEIVRATALAADVVPSVVHVDGTARPQTVPKDWPAAEFRRLIECFYEATGVPMVVNTSFNVRGEPIVCTPMDALRCFATSGLDVLYLGPFRVTRDDAARQNASDD